MFRQLHYILTFIIAITCSLSLLYAQDSSLGPIMHKSGHFLSPAEKEKLNKLNSEASVLFQKSDDFYIKSSDKGLKQRKQKSLKKKNVKALIKAYEIKNKSNQLIYNAFLPYVQKAKPKKLLNDALNPLNSASHIATMVKNAQKIKSVKSKSVSQRVEQAILVNSFQEEALYRLWNLYALYTFDTTFINSYLENKIDIINQSEIDGLKKLLASKPPPDNKLDSFIAPYAHQSTINKIFSQANFPQSYSTQKKEISDLKNSAVSMLDFTFLSSKNYPEFIENLNGMDSYDAKYEEILNLVTTLHNQSLHINKAFHNMLLAGIKENFLLTQCLKNIKYHYLNKQSTLAKIFEYQSQILSKKANGTFTKISQAKEVAYSPFVVKTVLEPLYKSNLYLLLASSAYLKLISFDAVSNSTISKFRLADPTDSLFIEPFAYAQLPDSLNLDFQRDVINMCKMNPQLSEKSYKQFNEIDYSICLGIYNNLDLSKLPHIDKFIKEEFTHFNLSRYYAGIYSSEDIAKETLFNKLLQNFPDAFVVSFVCETGTSPKMADIVVNDTSDIETCELMNFNYNKNRPGPSKTQKVKKKSFYPVVNNAFIKKRHKRASKNSFEGQYTIQLGAYIAQLNETEVEKNLGPIPGNYPIFEYYKPDKKLFVYSTGRFIEKNTAKKAQKNEHIRSGSYVTILPSNAQQINDNALLQSNKTYRIQLGAYKEPLTQKEYKEKFEGIKNLKIDKIFDPASNYYFYTTGNYSTYNDALNLQKLLKSKNFECFITIFEGNTKVVSKSHDSPYDKNMQSKQKRSVRNIKGLNYKIQVAVVKRYLTEKEIQNKFGKIPKDWPIDSYKNKSSGNIVYVVGKFTTYSQASKAKVKLNKLGINGFLVAYINNKKVTLFQARKYEESKK